MTTVELNKYIGRRAAHKTIFSVDVRIKDMRVIYGNTQALIEPVAGSGGAWVRLDSLANLTDAPK